MRAIGCVETRPDECYLWLVDNLPASTLDGWLEAGAHAGAVSSYVLAGIVRDDAHESDIRVIGAQTTDAALRSAIADAFDGLDAPQVSQGLLDGIFMQILSRLIKERLRDPAVLDLVIALGRKWRGRA